MSTENPSFHAEDDQIIRESHRLAYRAGDPELIDRYTLKLVLAVLDACDAGLPRQTIEAALREGFHQGGLQAADVSLTPDYWEAIWQEAEVFWNKRYDPDTSEDG